MTIRGRLRQAIEDAATRYRVPLKDLTVLAPQNDPFRVDTDRRHRDGEWLAITARDLGLADRKIHLRGLHYAIIGRPRPDGRPYANTAADWHWLGNDAGKAARWLGYLAFDQIVDMRNAAPIIRTYDGPTGAPVGHAACRVDVDIPAVPEVNPLPYLTDFPWGDERQPYRLVLIGEKSSLDDVLAPIAERYSADLYLPSGEASDSMLHGMAAAAAADGRPLVVLYFADSDPSGWQMPISVARKLQAFKVGLFPDLIFEVHRVALTPDQVRAYGLPSTPLKPTELRGEDWRAATGTAQTEIDALASLRPDLLREITHEAIRPFYDHTLAARTREVRDEWAAAARDAIEAQAGQAVAEQRAAAVARFDGLRAEVDEINERLSDAMAGVSLPDPPPVPGATVTGQAQTPPLIDSRWSFLDQCRRLADSKEYRDGGSGEDTG